MEASYTKVTWLNQHRCLTNNLFHWAQSNTKFILDHQMFAVESQFILHICMKSPSFLASNKTRFNLKRWTIHLYSNLKLSKLNSSHVRFLFQIFLNQSTFRKCTIPNSPKRQLPLISLTLVLLIHVPLQITHQTKENIYKLYRHTTSMLNLFAQDINTMLKHTKTRRHNSWSAIY